MAKTLRTPTGQYRRLCGRGEQMHYRVTEMNMRPFPSAVGILLSLALSADGAQIRRQASFLSNSYVVLIHATVLDRAGRPVRGLTRDNFRIFQEKVQRPITYFGEEDLPVSLAIVLDLSGSMKSNVSGARKAMRTVLETSNPDDEFSLITFSDRPAVTVPWVSDEALVVNGVPFNSAPHGVTSLLDAVHLAISQTKHANNPRRAVLILSDGGENHSRYREAEIAGMLSESNVQIYAVDMLESLHPPDRSAEVLAGPDLLERLCDSAGGRFFRVHDSRDLDNVADRIGKELRSVYVLGFVPPKSLGGGKFHELQVKVETSSGQPKVSVYSRHGYREPAE